MAGPRYFDRVLETTSSTGTGTVTLLGAQMGHQAFADRLSDGDTCYYAIAEQGGPRWEVGRGTFHSVGPTLSRDTVLDSSQGGSPVSFIANTKDVFLDLPADRPSHTAFLDVAQQFTAHQGFGIAPDDPGQSGYPADSAVRTENVATSPTDNRLHAAVFGEVQANPSADTPNSVYTGVLGIAYTPPGSTHALYELTGLNSITANKGAGAVNTMAGVSSSTSTSGPGTVTFLYSYLGTAYASAGSGNVANVYAFYSFAANYGTSTVTNAYGVFVDTAGSTGPVTNNYAFYAGDQTGQGTNSYSLWINSPGVHNVRADGSTAYHNPAFATKYVPGAVDFERVVEQWTANVAEFGTQAGTPTGVLRSMRLISNTVQVALAGASAPDASAQLQVDSVTRGFLAPRMTTTQRNAIASPATGLMVYNTTTAEYEFYNGTLWGSMGGGGGAVVSVGNSDGTLTVSPTTGAVVCSLNLAHANTWTSAQTVAPAARSSGSPADLIITGPADTGLTASTEAVGVNFNLSATRQWATGALTTQREFLIQAPTYAFAGASTLTNAATMAIAGAPVAGTNATITNSYALWVNSGAATAVAAVVQGVASQSADLQQWQSSTPTVLSRVLSDGRIAAPFGVQATPGLCFQGETNTGFYTTGGGGGIRISITGFNNFLFTSSGFFIFGAILRFTDGAGNNPADFSWLTANVLKTAWLQQTGGRARVTAPVTNATATMSNLTDLSVTLIAGRKYTGRLVLFAKNSTAAEGLAFDLNGGSATFTNLFFGFAATPPGGVTLGVLTSTAPGTALTATTATTADAVYTIEISIVCNAAGTFIPRFAEVSHTSGTATVELGSYLWLEDSPN